MPKMTTEQFLTQLGIEVGKPFIVTYKNGLSRKTRLNEWLEIYYELPNGKWETQDENLSSILDCEITPLPKYTLTEEDKTFVNSVYGYDEMLFVFRRVTGTLCLVNIGDKVRVLLNDDLCKFIKLGEKVSLDELRKCL